VNVQLKKFVYQKSLDFYYILIINFHLISNMQDEFLHLFHLRYAAMILDTEFNRVRDEVQETPKKEFQKRSMIQQHSKN